MKNEPIITNKNHRNYTLQSSPLLRISYIKKKKKCFDNTRSFKSTSLSLQNTYFKKKFRSPSKVSRRIPIIKTQEIADWSFKQSISESSHLKKIEVPIFNELKIDFMYKINGTSMYPKYNNGDLVACKKIHFDTFLEWNRVYVLQTDQGTIIKRIKNSTNENNILCTSENTKHPSFELPLTKIKTMAIVEAVIHLE